MLTNGAGADARGFWAGASAFGWRTDDSEPLRFSLAGSALLPWVGRLPRRGGFGGVDDHQHVAQLGNVALGEARLAHPTRHRRGQLDGRGFGRLNLAQGLEGDDLLAGRDFPHQHLGFVDALAQVRQLELERHFYSSMAARTAAAIRDASGRYASSSNWGG